MTASPGASIDEIAPDIYRVNVALPDALPGGFSFNQYLVSDERPLLFHTGPRKLFPLIREQIEKVIPVSTLRYIAFSHVEADECGSLGDFLRAAPGARPVCSEIGAMVSVSDLVDAEPVGMADAQALDLGRHRLTWQAAPHVPHGWDCGFMFDTTTRTLFCGDLFTQPGLGARPIVGDDILAPSEAFRREMDYFAHSPDTARVIGKLASLEPARLACMHGSAWHGDGGAMLRSLRQSLAVR
ncbi:MAG TPA: FprA family A-type flavoprotein [Casimicrobiaceae bacterium]|nr:FprA family A-type flavoprotein [Casimicrobiaceae bacterium]